MLYKVSCQKRPKYVRDYIAKGSIRHEYLFLLGQRADDRVQR